MENPFEIERRNYKDAANQASGLSSFGAFIKLIGVAIIGVGVIGGAAVLASGSLAAGLAMVVSVGAAGFIVLAMGSGIAASGQILGAIIDTAINTKVSANIAFYGPPATWQGPVPGGPTGYQVPAAPGVPEPQQPTPAEHVPEWARHLVPPQRPPR